MSNEKMSPAFETWFRKNVESPLQTERGFAWAVWQAALASAQQAGPELTDAEILAVRDQWMTMPQSFERRDDQAIGYARLLIAADRARRGGVEAEPVAHVWLRTQDLPWMIESLKMARLLVKRDRRNEEIGKVQHALEVELLNLPTTPPAAPVVPADISRPDWREVSSMLVKAWTDGADISGPMNFARALLATPSPAPEQPKRDDHANLIHAALAAARAGLVPGTTNWASFVMDQLYPEVYDEEPAYCNVCGGSGFRHGERHSQCGEAVMAAERKGREAAPEQRENVELTDAEPITNDEQDDGWRGELSAKQRGVV